MFRNVIFWLSTKKAFTDPIARTGMRLGFAKRFIAGERLEDALRAAAELEARGMLTMLNRLGEYVNDRREAEGIYENYIQMLDELAARKLAGTISIKPTQLGLLFDPALCRDLALRVVGHAASLNKFVEVDMEDSASVDATLELFEALRRKHENTGLAMQSYLYRTEKDMQRLKSLHPKIRLVKGAYREPASVAFPKKKEVDENYCKLTRLLFSDGFWPAIATHDPVMIEYAKQVAREHGAGPDRFEFQMIYGVRRDLQDQLQKEGYRMRVYIPFGTEWLPYFMRRMSERPANLWFVMKAMLFGR
ncbi:MAG TPA: proline dehydrogenase family protein [Candidatus Acidoferrales bacterium]|nr:proline dehydrogenase family protein [Candidatus Acidoferrales bacterium]